MVDRMNELAVKVDDLAIFPTMSFTPATRLTPEIIRETSSRMWDQTTGETMRNICLMQTWTIVGLAQYYKATHYEPARELARRLVNFHAQEPDTSRNGRAISTASRSASTAMVELAQATGDTELAREAQKALRGRQIRQRSIALADDRLLRQRARRRWISWRDARWAT